MTQLRLLSSDYQENDLVAVLFENSNTTKNNTSRDDEDEGKQNEVDSKNNNNNKNLLTRCRLCVVTAEGGVIPLCQRTDDVETDLYADPREYYNDDNKRTFWMTQISNQHVLRMYGEGFYGQRPVPSLGGGPGYGADADEVWSIDQTQLDMILTDGVVLPELDIGIAHGEKARAGAF